MTQNEFISNFRKLLEQYDSTEFDFYSDDIESTMVHFVNDQKGEIWGDYPTKSGIDNDNAFYIYFEVTNCQVYEEDLEINNPDVWEELWENITYVFPYYQKGDKVYWDDPAIYNYDKEERENAFKRIFVIVGINGHIITISDGHTEAEVMAIELKRFICS